MPLHSSQPPHKPQPFPLCLPGTKTERPDIETSLRDYLAAHALSSLIQFIPPGAIAKDSMYMSMAQSAYKIADAMLKARKL